MTTATAPSKASQREAPVLALLRHTPIRDLVRGRLTGRLDVKRRIAAADLPPSVADLVWHITRRTRLSRMEKVEVAEELAAHFADGLEAGATGDALINDFGDPARAARLIRRAKKRARPAAWRAAAGTFRAICLGLGVIILFYVLYGVYFFTASPSPSVDYLALVNAAAAAVPEEARAWPLYRAALIQLEDHKELSASFNRWPMPGEEGWDEVASYLDRQAEALALARQAASRPGLGYVAGSRTAEEDLVLWPDNNDFQPAGDGLDDSLVNLRLPHLNEFRKLARMLALDAQRAAAAGDGDAAVDDLAAMFAMAGHLQEAPIIINDLVALSIARLACETAGDILVANPQVLSEDNLKELAHRAAADEALYEVDISGERMFFQDIVQRVFTDDGAGDGRLTGQGVRMLNGLSAGGGLVENIWRVDDLFFEASLPAVGMIMASRRELLDEHLRLMDIFEAEARRPLWEMDMTRADQRLEKMQSGSIVRRVRMMPVTLLMPALGKAAQMGQFGVARRDALLTALALELHHRRTGSWPETLEALVPELLPAVPLDRFDGQPLRYVLVDGRPLLYSVGTDRDDDGGQRLRPDRSWRARYVDAMRVYTAEELAQRRKDGEEIPDGDWILWPRPVEPVWRYER